MFADILVDGVPLVTSVMVHDGDPLVRYQYLGFSGDLVIVDTQGADDPLYMGLGDRWLLLYTPA
jgi:hypothetical protein